MKAYKLLNHKMQAHNSFQYELNKPIVFAGQPILCGENCLHFYDDPLLAVMFNPIHSNIYNPRLFVGDTLEGVILNDKGTKYGSNQLIITEEIKLPKVTLINRIAFGILCAKTVVNNDEWNKWADKWLSNADRSKESTYAAAAAYAAADAADAADADAYAAKNSDFNLSDIAKQAMLIV